MKLALFNAYKIWGGGERWFLECSRFALERGIEVVVFTPKDGELAKRLPHDPKLRVIDVQLGKYSYFNPIILIRFLFFFILLRPSTIVFNSIPDVRSAALMARLAGIKKRVFRAGTPLPPKEKLSYLICFRLGLTHFTPISKAILEIFQNQSPRIIEKTNNDVIITNSVDLNRFIPSKKEKIHSSFITTIGNAVRLCDQKGLDYLFESLKILKDRGHQFIFKLAGTGELENKLKFLASDLGIDHIVQFLGHTDDVPSFLHELDIMAFSSKYEGTALTILEAMACEVPVVAFDTSSMKEMIKHEQTGLLVSAFDVSGFADALERLITDQQLRLRIIKEARNYVLTNHSKEINFQKWLHFLIS